MTNDLGPDRRAFLGVLGAAACGASVAQPAMGRTQTPAPDLEGPWTGRGSVARGGGVIHYVEMGQGEPVVLLPKLGGWVADWRKVAPLLARDRRVIAIDPPGHGGSKMLGPPPYLQTVAESTALVKAALDNLGVEQFSLVGNSLGGCISVLMSAFWPEAVRKLVLLSVSLSDGFTPDEVLKQDAELVRNKTYDIHDTPLPRTAEQVARFGSKDPAVISESNLSRSEAGRWVRPSERGVARAAVSAYLTRISAPTLLIYGQYGYYKQFEAIAMKSIKNTRTVTIPDCGSFTHQEKPVETAAAINAFLGAA